MAKNIAFKAFTEGASWADDDDELDAQPFILTPPKVPEAAEKEQPEEEAPARRDDSHDKHADASSRGSRQDRNYDDRRGSDRSADRRGSNHSADRRGGGGYRDDSHHHHDRESHSQRGGGDYAERPKNPLPDRPPYKLYVGNLPFQMREDDLAEFLGNVESISDIHFPVDHELNRPKGFAYVEFKTREALVKALELDGVNAGGRAVKIDVASERRQERSGGFFDRRESRPARSHDREERAPPAARERPHFALLPRTTASTEPSDTAAKKASIFGDAKPRDESVYLERQKAKELERKKEKEAARKKEQERKKELAERKKANEKELLTRKPSVDELTPPTDESSSDKKQHGPLARKNSHDDNHGFRAAGANAGRGSTRGGRGGDRAGREHGDHGGRGSHSARGGEHGGRGGRGGRGGEHGGREHSGRGRGGEHSGRGGRSGEHGGRGGRGGEHGGRGSHGGRGAHEGSASAKEPDLTTAAPVTARKSSEPRAKRVEPVKVKIAAPAPVMNVNAFSALDLDSDSD